MSRPRQTASSVACSSSTLLLAMLLLCTLVPMVACGRDYYDLLGVPRDSPASVIKKAYRQMAKRYHPDKHPGNKAMENKFKDISQAYEVLSDQQKRQVYDQFGEEGLKNNNGGGGPGGTGGHQFHFGGGGGGFHMEFDESMFENMFGGFDGGHGGGGGGRNRRRFHQREQRRRRVCEENKVCENDQCYMVKECRT